MHPNCPTLLSCVSLLLASVTSAQLPPGVGADAYGRYYSCFNPGGSYNNPTSALIAGQGRLMDNMIREQIMYEANVREIRRRWGAAKIADGAASTTFTASEKGSTLAARLPKNATPDEITKTTAATRATLDAFNKAMAQEGLKTNDIADGIALAFVMSYAAMNEQDPGSQRLILFRDSLKKRLLTDPIWQSHTDEERQGEYENAAINAMSAIATRVSSKDPARSEKERSALADASSRLSMHTIQSHLPPGLFLEGLELTPEGFGDKGERLAKLGTGSTVFKRTEPSAIIEQYVANWRSPEKSSEYFQKRLSRFAKVIDAAGGKPDDFADANAATVAILYYVKTNGAVELSRVQVEWLRAEMRKDVLASASFQRTSDSNRQRAFDKMAIDAIYLRDQYAEQSAILAMPIPTDPLHASLVRMEQGSARDQRARLINSANEQLTVIFKPRDMKDIVLDKTGFAPVGTTMPIENQTATSDSPARAAFAK